MARAEPPSTMMGTLGVRESNSARMTTPATMRIIRAFREIGMGVGLLGRSGDVWPTFRSVCMDDTPDPYISGEAASRLGPASTEPWVRSMTEDAELPQYASLPNLFTTCPPACSHRVIQHALVEPLATSSGGPAQCVKPLLRLR